MEADIYDETVCDLGEGPLWHPLRQELFWFDIPNQVMYSRCGEEQRQWEFDIPVSAAGWIDQDKLLIASGKGLLQFDVETGGSEIIALLESEDPLSRTNDGRADPFGGFWIGTMALDHKAGAGAIYRYYKGEERKLQTGITVPNAICFSPDGGHAHFADSMQQKIMRQRLNPTNGWPEGDAEVFIDLTGRKFGPDGAVVDAAGNLWNACWGGYAVACYGPDGELKETLALPTALITCPAFGGPDLTTLFVASARIDLNEEKRRQQPAAGKVFLCEGTGPGQPEHQVKL